jgi:hypothetical protein
MAASPRWKVYSKDREYVAATKYVEDAAAILALRGEGTEIRDGHLAKWAVFVQGQETVDAGDSADGVREIVAKRVLRRIEERGVGRDVDGKLIFVEADGALRWQPVPRTRGER